jgi:hypothetical protein
MIRLRRFHLRASTFALPPSRFHLRALRFGGQVALRRTGRASADKSRYGGQVAATARQARFGSFAASARQARCGGFAASARQVVVTAAFVLIAGGSSLLACPLCFGAEETSMIDGTKLGVLVLLAVTLAVQGAFVAFFLHLRKRAKRMADVELDTEWSELQRSPRTS